MKLPQMRKKAQIESIPTSIRDMYQNSKEEPKRKPDLFKVDCCDVCFEEYRFEPNKQKNSFVSINVNNRQIKFCEDHLKGLYKELSEYINELEEEKKENNNEDLSLDL